MPIHSRQTSIQQLASPRARRSLAHNTNKFPVELTDAIVEILLETEGRKFSAIAQFSLASRQFRQIAYRSYFSNIKLNFTREIGKIRRFPAWFCHIRTMSITSNVLQTNSLPMDRFPLTTLHISFLPESLLNLHTRVVKDLQQLPVTITTLKLTSLPQISKALLEKIAHRCPNIQVLELSVAERVDDACCWGCLEESAGCVVHSPVGSMVDTIEELAIYYSTPLKLFKHLRHLSLGVFVSHETVLYDHIDGHPPEVEKPSSPLSSPSVDVFSAPQSPMIQDMLRRENLVMGMSTPLSMAPYLSRHNAVHECAGMPSTCVDCLQKHSLRGREDELTLSIRMAQILKDLETVRWSSWFSCPDGGEPDNVEEAEFLYDGGKPRWTKLWILRKNGRIRVRRRPW